MDLAQQRVAKNGEISGIFVVRDPLFREKIFFGGLLLLFLHPVGWPASLGYRKSLISRLFSGEEPLLPVWKGNVWYFFFEGLKAMGVIFGYLSPLYLALFLILYRNGVSPDAHWLLAAAFFCFFMIFSTLSLPLAILYWTFGSAGYRLPVPYAGALLLAFAVVVFFIPAGFLQVSKSGKYRSAFHVFAAFTMLRTHFKRYLLAWYRSAVMSLAGHLALPFAPWGVVWCYLGIIYEFNSILARDAGFRYQGSWFERLDGAQALKLEPTLQKSILRCSNATGAGGKPCFFLLLGPILVPLPELACRILKCTEG